MGLTGIPPAALMREGNPRDPRAQRTRDAIMTAYQRTVFEGREIESVSTLVKDAGISRSSFYLHFTGVESVGLAILRTILERFDPRKGDGHSSGDETRPASLRELFEYLQANRDLCAHVLASTQDRTPLEELQTAIAEQLADAVRSVRNRPDVDVYQLASFISGGITALVVGWLRAPANRTSDGMALDVMNALPDWARQADAFAMPLRVTDTDASDTTPPAL